MDSTNTAKILSFPGNRQIALLVHDAVAAGIIDNDMIGLFRFEKLQPPDILPVYRKRIAELMKSLQEKTFNKRDLMNRTKRLIRLLNGHSMQFMIMAEMVLLDVKIKMRGYDEKCGNLLGYFQALILVAIFYPAFLHEKDL